MIYQKQKLFELYIKFQFEITSEMQLVDAL